MGKAEIRKKILNLLKKFWWILLIIAGISFFVIGVPIFKYFLYAIGIIIALLIFSPFIIQLFAPIFVSISSLAEHFRESKGESAGKRYFFIPASIIAVAGFGTAQAILSIWVFVVSFLVWLSIIGFFFTFIAVFFFGLAPFAILTAPFVIWIKAGFAEFIAVAIFFLFAVFWYSFSKFAFSPNYWESTPEKFLGYSPQIFLLGALSFQVIALPLYNFGLFGIGNLISDLGGFIFLIFALISAFKWNAIKKKLSETEKEGLYKLSVWLYIFGFIFTNILYIEFRDKFGAPTAVLFWLNGFFLVALIGRFFGIFKRKKPKLPQIETNV